jgi:hypothetical protein
MSEHNMSDHGASKHPSFEEPEDPKAQIWRYLDLAKFLSLLEKSALYFCRVDLLGDPFEGSRPRGEDALWEGILKQDDTKKEVLKYNKQMINESRRMIRRTMYANCWHLNDHESAAMWHVYSRDAASIALQSTFGRLRDCLHDSIHIGIVKYIDYETESVPFDNMFNYFLHKRKSFEHERELRALIWTMERSTVEGKAEWKVSSEQPGIEVPVDLTQLVEQVVIAPEAPGWFFDLVVEVVKRYGFELEVRQSSLSAKPDL